MKTEFNQYNLYSKKGFLLLLLSFIPFISFAGVIELPDGFGEKNSTSIEDGDHEYVTVKNNIEACYRVDNNSGESLFVPLKTNSELDSILCNSPDTVDVTTYEAIPELSCSGTSIKKNGLVFEEKITGEINLINGDQFGSSISVHENLIAVGVPNSDVWGSNKGGVYVFENRDNYVENIFRINDAIFSDISLDNHDNFGKSIFINEDKLLVGTHADDDGGTNRGAVYVFEKFGIGWRYVEKISDTTLPALNLEDGDLFGSSVAMHDGKIYVGASKDDDGGTNRGAVYILARESNSWVVEAKISSTSNTELGLRNNDNFGQSFSTNGSVIAVSARLNDDHANNSGSVYLLTKDSDGDWRQNSKLNGSTPALSGMLTQNDQFGSSVDISNGILSIGAEFDDDGASNSGSVFVFTLNGSSTSFVGKISNDTNQYLKLTSEDRLGSAVGYHNDLFFVGARLDDDGGGNKGAMYIMRRDGSSFELIKKISGYLNLKAGDEFGSGLSIYEDTIALGVPKKDEGGQDRGVVYILERSGITWVFRQEIKGSSLGFFSADGDRFGASISIGGDYMAIGSPQGEGDNAFIPGSVSIFKKNSSGVWEHNQDIDNSTVGANFDDSDRFGISVSLSGNTLVVGAPNHDTSTNPSSSNKGAIYFFERNTTTDLFEYDEKIDHSSTVQLNSVINTNFGLSVAIKGDVLLVSSNNNLNSDGTRDVVLFFNRVSDSWVYNADNSVKDDIFQVSSSVNVDIVSENSIIVGTHQAGRYDRGAAYFIEKDGNGDWFVEREISDPNDECLTLNFYDHFGSDVSRYGNYFVVGARRDDNSATDAGAVYIFNLDDSAICGCL